MYPMARLPALLRCVLTLSVVTTATVAALCAQTTRQPMTDVSGAARLVAFTGQISVLRGSEPWALNVGDYVQPLQVIVTGDGSGMFKVADGSTFEVFSNSKVIFRPNYGNWEDLLELWLGKIKVQIEHPGGVLPNPNRVRTPTAVISVRGTTFDVAYDADKGFTTVEDEEGSVEVARALRLDDKKILTANQSLVVYKNEPLARHIDTGGILKRIYQAAMDALTQQEINNRSSGPAATTPTGTTTAPPPATTTTGDHNSNNPPPPPPPAPPN
jgi:ferric-dicitrate binding protein FerR (iron transport regulator)